MEITNTLSQDTPVSWAGFETEISPVNLTSDWLCIVDDM